MDKYNNDWKELINKYLKLRKDIIEIAVRNEIEYKERLIKLEQYINKRYSQPAYTFIENRDADEKI